VTQEREKGSDKGGEKAHDGGEKIPTGATETLLTKIVRESDSDRKGAKEIIKRWREKAKRLCAPGQARPRRRKEERVRDPAGVGKSRKTVRKMADGENSRLKDHLRTVTEVLIYQGRK